MIMINHRDIYIFPELFSAFMIVMMIMTMMISISINDRFGTSTHQ